MSDMQFVKAVSQQINSLQTKNPDKTQPKLTLTDKDKGTRDLQVPLVVHSWEWTPRIPAMEWQKPYTCPQMFLSPLCLFHIASSLIFKGQQKSEHIWLYSSLCVSEIFCTEYQTRPSGIHCHLTEAFRVTESRTVTCDMMITICKR